MKQSENRIHVHAIANRIMNHHEPGAPVPDDWILDLCDRSLALVQDYAQLHAQYSSLLNTLHPQLRSPELPHFVAQRRNFG